jgi:hypothetical protein
MYEADLAISDLFFISSSTDGNDYCLFQIMNEKRLQGGDYSFRTGQTYEIWNENNTLNIRWIIYFHIRCVDNKNLDIKFIVHDVFLE